MSSPADVLFGIPPIGQLAMALARSTFVAAVDTEAGKQLIEVMEDLTLVDDKGEISLIGASRAILTAMSSAGSTDRDNDWNALTREAIRAIAQAAKASLRGKTASGEPLCWATFAEETLDGHGEQGNAPFNRADFIEVTSTLHKYAKLQGKRARAAQVAVDGRPRREHVRAAQQDAGVALSSEPHHAGPGPVPPQAPFPPSVGINYYVGDGDPRVARAMGACEFCGEGLMSHFATCAGCNSMQSGCWRCPACNLMTRGDGPRCGRAFGSGCPGLKVNGREATGAEVSAMLAVQKQVQSEAPGGLSRGSPPGGGKGGKGGGALVGYHGGRGGRGGGGRGC